VRPAGLVRAVLVTLCLVGTVASAAPARAEIPSFFDGKRIVAVEVSGESASLMSPADVGVAAGSLLTRELVRDTIMRLLATERFTDVQIDAYAGEGGVHLLVHIKPRVVVSRVQITGTREVSRDAVRDALGVADHSEVSTEQAGQLESNVRRAYAEHGYMGAVVDVSYRDTDNPSTKVLMVSVEEGPPTRIRGVSFTGDRPLDPTRLLDTIGIARGEVLNRENLGQDVAAAEAYLRRQGFYEARLERPLVTVRDNAARVSIPARLGPRYEVRIQGHAPLGAREVQEALELNDHRLTRSRRRDELAALVVDLYRRHGFPQARVRVLRLEGKQPGTAVLQIQVAPGAHLEVLGVSFMGAKHFAQDFLRDQLFSYLEEDLPNAGLLAAVDSEVADGIQVGDERPRKLPRPLQKAPRKTYYEDTYEDAVKHITELYNADGFLSAEVGPARLQRLSEQRATVNVPVVEGPRTRLHSVVIEGSRLVGSRKLLIAARLQRNQPFSYLAMEEARRRIAEAYMERGHMFVTVEPLVRFSGDQTRAELTVKITEGYPVHVDQIVIQGADRTSEVLVRRLLEFRPGDLYRPSLARRSEEEIMALGVFQSVSVGLEEPGLPAQAKSVIVRVSERHNQFLDFSAGISTGQGIRGGFEYGYRNLFGQAIGLTMRVHLAHQLFFVDKQVEERFKRLTDLEKRIERNISLGLVAPRLRGLGRVRTNVDLVHLRDNERDFGLDKNGVGLTFTYRPVKPLTLTLGGDLENNNVELFVEQELDDYLAGTSNTRLRRLLRVPAGNTTLVAGRTTASLDQRDNPFVPTRGYFASVNGELAQTLTPARQLDEESVMVDEFVSKFLKVTVTTSAYAPIGKAVVLAGQARVGRVFHMVEESRTYPNRAFFLGGVDTMRGYPEDSMVPQDVAEEIVNDPDLTPNSIVRSADTFMLARGELRFPIYGQLRAGLFTDFGNLWADADGLNPTRLRPTVGLGMRLATPVGPVAVDYGIIVRRRRELAEPFGTLHFSIGLF